MSDDLSLSRESLLLEAAALLEISERRKQFPLFWYDPASQKIASFHASQARIRILAGGNRSGKTESNAAEICAAALGYRPWVLRELNLPMPKSADRPANLPEDAIVFNSLGIRIQIPADIGVITGLPAKQGIGEVLVPKLTKYLGPLIEKTWAAHGGVLGKIRLKNGSTIHLASAEQDLTAFEGVAYSSVHIDEPIPKRIYTALRRASIDQGARVTATFTPIGRWASWVLRDLYTVPDRKKVEVFQVSIFDNKFLSPEAVKEFAEDPTMSAMERDARLYGRFSTLADSVWCPPFESDVHVIEPFALPKHWAYVTAIDPGVVKPWAIILIGISPDGTMYVVKEWPHSDITKIRRDTKTMQEWAATIRDMEADLPISGRVLDPNMGISKPNVRGHQYESMQHELARYGVYCDCMVNDNIEYGEARVRELLAYRKSEPLSSVNRPRIYFFKDCHNCINSMLYYSAKDKARSDGQIDEEQRDETYKDFADAIRYGVVKYGQSYSPVIQDYYAPQEETSNDDYY